jgi:hypothetical protein
VGALIAGVVSPNLWTAWAAKEIWAGCRKMSSEGAEQWLQAKHCPNACHTLGSAGILTVLQFQSSQKQWLHVEELLLRQCQCAAVERSKLVSWMNSALSAGAQVAALDAETGDSCSTAFHSAGH